MDEPHTITVPAGHSAFVFPTPDAEEDISTVDEAQAALERFLAKHSPRQPRHSNGKPEVHKYSRGGLIGKHNVNVWAVG